MEYILPITAIGALGDWSFAKFVKEGSKNLFYKLFGYLNYFIVLEYYQGAIEKKGLAWANTAWDGWSDIFTNLVALLYFKETPTGKELLGILLVMSGLFLLGTRGTNHKSS
jgi:uncharacterized membrane protein